MGVGKWEDEKAWPRKGRDGRGSKESGKGGGQGICRGEREEEGGEGRRRMEGGGENRR